MILKCVVSRVGLRRHGQLKRSQSQLRRCLSVLIAPDQKDQCDERNKHDEQEDRSIND